MKLSMQILADSMQRHNGRALGSLSQARRIVGVRLHEEGSLISSEYVYIIADKTKITHAGAYICAGTPLAGILRDVISFPQDTPVTTILKLVQETFEFYEKWNSDLQGVLNKEGEAQELLELSLPVFNNPIFVHDQEFYLTAIAGEDPAKNDWVTEEGSNKLIFNSDLLNIYKIDEHYMNSLKIHGAAIFPEVMRDYPILFLNLWRDNHYIGRICVNAKESPITQGQLQLIEHLGDAILVVLRRKNEHSKQSSRVLEMIITNMIEGKDNDEQEVIRNLSNNGWKRDDQYVCIKVGVHKRDEDIMSFIATCNRLESLIDGSFAFLYKNSILIIVNLTYGNYTLSDCLAQLGAFLREGLFKSGSSDDFWNFFDAGKYFRQAKAALEIGSLCDETLWSYRFSKYAMRYFFCYGCSEMPVELLCSRDVLVLDDYDKKNNTKLYSTLRTYIANNLNATQTAKAMFIHRSTFFYRLEQIKGIIKSNLESENQRFYLQLSFMLLENGNLKNKDSRPVSLEYL